jgi:hypothetical protein
VHLGYELAVVVGNGISEPLPEPRARRTTVNLIRDHHRTVAFPVSRKILRRAGLLTVFDEVLTEIILLGYEGVACGTSSPTPALFVYSKDQGTKEGTPTPA